MTRPRQDPGRGTRWHPRVGLTHADRSELLRVRQEYVRLLGNPAIAPRADRYFRGAVRVIDELTRSGRDE